MTTSSEQEPWDELMGGPSKAELKNILHGKDNNNGSSDEEDPTQSETPSSSIASASRMPSRWAQYEKDTEKLRHESHEANCKAVELAAEKVIANSPPRSVVTSGRSTPSATRQQRNSVSLPMVDSYESDDGSGEYGWENDEAIRAEALKMLELADDHLSHPYSVRKTQSGGFSASYSGGFGGTGSLSGSRRSSSSSTGKGKHVPRALAGIDFSKRASSSSSRASYTSSLRYGGAGLQDDDDEGEEVVMMPNAEEESFLDVIEMENAGSSNKKDSPASNRWSSRYSIDHTLLALSGGRTRSGNVKDVLNHMERETDREIKSARNMYMSSPHDTPRIFGSASNFSFRDNPLLGKYGSSSKNNSNNTAGSSSTKTYSHITSQTNLKTQWLERDGLDDNGNSLTPFEPRKTWQEQVERKKRQQRRIALASFGLCLAVAILIGVMASRGRGSDSKDTLRAPAFDTSATTTTTAGAGRGTPQVVFYVTSDSPYDSDEEQKLTADLQAIPDADFVVHLGNIQNSAVTLCSESRYGRVKDVLLQCPVPMFILPGEEDWNNCPNPENAWETWQDTFENFETNFNHNFMVSRQMRRKENFAFLHRDVLFIGFHLVGGRINNQEEVEQRMADNINWLESMVTMNQEDFKYIVMLGNARPGPQQKVFFDRLAEFLGPYEVPIVYVHANSGVGGVMQYDLFGGGEGIEGLQIEDGGQNPPLRVSIYDGDAPFVVG